MFNDSCLITKEFPIHSSFSILPKQSFETDKNGNLIKLNKIIQLEKQLIFQNLPEKILQILNQYFIPKDDSKLSKNNEFLIAGNFSKKFDVNYRFCIWMDNENSNLIYCDKDKKNIEIKVDAGEKIGNKKYSLICSKYKIKYFY